MHQPPGVFQDLQLSEIAPNLQFPELANNCARPAAALRDDDIVRGDGVLLVERVADLGLDVRVPRLSSGREGRNLGIYDYSNKYRTMSMEIHRNTYLVTSVI